MMGAISYIKMINDVNNKIPLKLYPIQEYKNIYENLIIILFIIDLNLIFNVI